MPPPPCGRPTARRLRDLHITRQKLHDFGFDKLYDKLKGTPEERLQKKAIAISIEEELQTMPWVLTSNFHAFKHGRCLLALRGVADPTGCGQGHAYTKLMLRERVGDEDREEEARPAQPCTRRASPPRRDAAPPRHCLPRPPPH